MSDPMNEGVETRTLKTVLGMEDEGVSTSDTYTIVVKDHGTKSGLKYDSVCITPAVDVANEDEPEKTLQVLYTREKQQGGLNYATVAIYENPREVDEASTTSKIVHLRSSKKEPGCGTGGHSDQVGVFSSDAETSNCIRFGPTNADEEDNEHEGVFASDPEALKFIKFGPKPATSGAASAEEPEGIIASDPEALKFIKFGPKPASFGAASAEEPEGIFASDPEALKLIKFGPKPATSGAASSEEPEGIFASDPEALKLIKFGPMPASTGASIGINSVGSDARKFIHLAPRAAGTASNGEPEGIFASDPEALKFIKFGPPPAATGAANSSGSEARIQKQDDSAHGATAGEGELLAEANGVELKDKRTYSVRVSGHNLPDGQVKKFVTVSRTDGQEGPTREDIDRMEVSVETTVGEDGMVEKFVVVE